MAPKKAGLIKQKKLTKVCPLSVPQKNQVLIFNQQLTSGLVSMTEKSLATKAGHLELLAGGKKDRLQKERNQAKKDGTLKSGPKKA